MYQLKALPWGAGVAGGLVVALVGCSGQLSNEPSAEEMGELAAGGSAAAGGGSGGVFAGQNPEAQAEQDAIDAELSASNPELFEVANSYFPNETLAAAPTRLYRLTRTQLDATTQTLLPGVATASAVDALPADPLIINYEYAENLSFSAANFEPYRQWVEQIANSIRANPSSVIDCDVADTACLQSQAQMFVARAFRNVPSPEQIQSFVDFFLQSVTAVGLADATGDLVDVTLTSPHYVFRDEVLTGANGALRPAQLLQHVTYTLADSHPAGLGIPSDTAQAAVGTADALRGTIAQVLASPAARDKLTRFITTWLEIKQPQQFQAQDLSTADAVAMVQDATSFLTEQLSVAAPTLTGITQSLRVGLDPAERLGIFTEPAFIVSHSGPTQTRPIHRGVFFVRKVMCQELGMPPAGVNTELPDDPDATERQRIEAATQPATCAACHSLINPYGFMLENYDHIGQWRTSDEEGRPINASITLALRELDAMGMPTDVSLATDSPVVALQGMARSLQFQQCFARQMFRYYLGRRELPTDDPTLRQMFFQFAEANSQNIIGMLATLAGSRTFSDRLEAP
jgi:hypothetical protein